MGQNGQIQLYQDKSGLGIQWYTSNVRHCWLMLPGKMKEQEPRTFVLKAKNLMINGAPIEVIAIRFRSRQQTGTFKQHYMRLTPESAFDFHDSTAGIHSYDQFADANFGTQNQQNNNQNNNNNNNNNINNRNNDGVNRKEKENADSNKQHHIDIDRKNMRKKDLYIEYYGRRKEINNTLSNCRLSSNFWDDGSELNDICSPNMIDREFDIEKMIAQETAKLNSWKNRLKKIVQSMWNSLRRSLSFVDLFTDLRLLYLVSTSNNPILDFVIILSVSVVCPYIVSYSCGVKLFFINRDNNYDVKNLIVTNSYDGYVAFKKVIAYLSLSPIGVLYFLFLDLIDILFVYYKLIVVIFFGKNEIEMKKLEEIVAKQLGMTRMDYEGIKRQRATAQLSLAIFCIFYFYFCFLFLFFIFVFYFCFLFALLAVIQVPKREISCTFFALFYCFV